MSAKTKIEILVAPGCTSREKTEEQVAKLLAQTSVNARVVTTVVEDTEHAIMTGFLGSPSVRVNGIDVEEGARGRKEYGMG